MDGEDQDDYMSETDAEIARRTRANARDDLRGLTARLNRFLIEDDYRALLSFAELKVLGTASDVMTDIAGRLNR